MTSRDDVPADDLLTVAREVYHEFLDGRIYEDHDESTALLGRLQRAIERPADTHSPGVSVSACVALVQELAKLNDPHGYPGIAASIFAPFVKKARAAVGADVPAGSAPTSSEEER